MDYFYPSSDEEVGRGAIVVSVATKNNICRRVMDDRESYRLVSDSSRIEQFTVRQWVMKLKRGKKLHERVGRPRLVDEDLMVIIRAYLHNNNAVTDEVLKGFIRREYDISLRRKLGEVVNEEILQGNRIKYQIKRHTLYRLVRKLRFTEEDYW